MLPTNIQTLKQSELGCCHTARPGQRCVTTYFAIMIEQKAKGNGAALQYLLLNFKATCADPTGYISQKSASMFKFIASQRVH